MGLFGSANVDPYPEKEEEDPLVTEDKPATSEKNEVEDEAERFAALADVEEVECIVISLFYEKTKN